jgi:hypothetical protein
VWQIKTPAVILTGIIMLAFGLFVHQAFKDVQVATVPFAKGTPVTAEMIFALCFFTFNK